jgi:outer membrane protein insertion porin family
MHKRHPYNVWPSLSGFHIAPENGKLGRCHSALTRKISLVLFVQFAFIYTAPGSLQGQGAFPTSDHGTAAPILPTEADEAGPGVEDGDDPVVRTRTPEDDLRFPKGPSLKKTPVPPLRDRVNQDAGELPDAPIVKAIEVAGAGTTEDSRKALSAIATREGEPLNPDKQRKDIERLYKLGIFQPDINVQAVEETGGVKLVYAVQPNPKVGKVGVTGNSQVTTEKLLKELPVKEGEAFTIQAQNKLQDSLTRYYEEKGYTDAAVKVEERPGPGNTVDLDIAVNEGTKMLIRNLNIRGNKSASNFPLKLRTANRGSWGPLKRYYNEAKFEEDLDNIRAYYATKGFLDADVKRGEFAYAQDKSWVDPSIDINEGPQYRVGRLEAKGYSVFSREEILEPFREMQGKIYNAAEFQKMSERVKNMYGDEGFLNCDLEPELHKDPSSGIVDVSIDIAEGSRIYVGDVRIVAESYPDDADKGWLRRYYSRFSPPVKDQVVQNELQMRPGQVYRRFDEVRSKEKLRSLSVFDKIDIHEQMTDESNVRDCVVEVEQGNTGNLIFGVGFGDQQGGFLYANYTEHNLFGMARDLKVSTLLGTREISGEISYLDRYFMGTDIDAKFSVFHRRIQRTGSFGETNTGVTSEFTRPLEDCLKDSIRLRLEAVGYDVDDDDQPAHELDNYLAATIRYRITHDTRDDTFFPTSGHIAMAGLETGAAGGFLAKLEGQYAQYWQISDSWVLANNTVGGLMPYDATNIGYADRFFMGGGGDLRGFRYGGAGPHDRKESDIPLGGSTKLLTQFEARHLFTDNIAGVLFADAGMLGRKTLDIESPRGSVGAGVRMRLPFASIAVDLAVPVVSKDNDQTQFFHFNMSSAF